MNREIIRLKCVDDDWLKIGKPVPSEIYRYVLCKCNNCGMLIPIYDKEKELIIKRYTNDIIDKQMGEC